MLGYTAALDLDSVTTTTASSAIALAGAASFKDLLAGLTESYTVHFDTSTVGAFEAFYTFGLSDEEGVIGGSADDSDLLTLIVQGTVVPEPASLLLIGAGSLMLLTRARRQI